MPIKLVLQETIKEPIECAECGHETNTEKTTYQANAYLLIPCHETGISLKTRKELHNRLDKLIIDYNEFIRLKKHRTPIKQKE
jgi:transcription elongation factor Elf1